MCANDRIHYGPMVIFVCLHFTLPHYHQYADVYEGIEFLEYLFIFHAIYGAVCIQPTHFANDGCENIYTISYYHHQVGSMTHLPLFKVKS